MNGYSGYYKEVEKEYNKKGRDDCYQVGGQSEGGILGCYIVFFCLLFIVKRQFYPKILYHNPLPLHLKADTIIEGEDFKNMLSYIDFQDFVMSLINFLNWDQNYSKMELHFLCQKVKDTYNG